MASSTFTALEEHNYMFKSVLLGDMNVGKTNLLLRYSKDEFQEGLNATVGAEISTKTLLIPDNQNNPKRVKCHIWDTAGQEKFRSISTYYYKSAQGAIFVYDITSKDTFKNIDMWVEEIKQFAEEGILKLLIGNKKDLSQIREVTTDEALAYAEKNNMAFFEASALDGSNVTKAFDHIINEVFRLSQNIPDKCQQKKKDNQKLKLPIKITNNKSCC